MLEVVTQEWNPHLKLGVSCQIRPNTHVIINKKRECQRGSYLTVLSESTKLYSLSQALTLDLVLASCGELVMMPWFSTS